MADDFYVRTEMLPEQTPPVTQTGIIGWLRENMFSNIPNSILTLIAFYLIYQVLGFVLPWIFESSWSANSLAQCRDAIHATYGPDVTGACWAVIRERYHQLLFGFYPAEFYWRPILAVILMLVAIGPVLFDSLPRKMLWFSGLYPFVAFFLLWGGTVFLPLTIILGFGIAVAAAIYLPRFIGSLGGVIAAIVLPLIWWIVLAGPSVNLMNHILAGPLTNSYISRVEGEVSRNEAIVADQASSRSEISTAKGMINQGHKRINDAKNLVKLQASIATLKVTADKMRAALPASVRKYGSVEDVPITVSKADVTKLEDAINASNILNSAKKKLTLVFSRVGRVGLQPVESAKFGGFMLSIVIGVTGIVLSLPLGVLLALGRQSNLLVVKTICVGFIEFIRGVPLITLLFVASTLLNYFLPPGTTFDIILRVMIMVTLFSSAYMAEVIRGGLAALPLGQYEAADALGLDYWKSMRLIIMPQALKISIPSIVGIFIGLFKDTTLVSIIGLMDPLGLSNAIRADANWNGIVWELYGFIAFMFFVFCFAMGRYSMYLERKLQTGHV